MRCILLSLFLACLFPAVGSSMIYVSFQRDDKDLHVTGELIVEASDGGVLVVANDGKLWAIQPDEIVRKDKDDKPFVGLTQAEVARRLAAEMPEGFEIYTTAHYVFCYNTSKPYAQWCGALYERLYVAFYNYWERRGFKLRQPLTPLVAIIYRDQADFARFSRDELGDAAESIIGYYSIETNRVSTFDLTGVGGSGNARATKASEINRILSAPDALRTVATIIHEATHQLAHNSGMHERWGDIPLWVREGIAMYFETPDLGVSRGWRTIGAVNRPRLVQLREYAQRRPGNSLATLIADDSRLSDANTALDAYAETWALTYYLIRFRGKEYRDYLAMIAKKPALVEDTPETRLKEFQHFFGDLNKLEAEFVRKIGSLR